MNDIIKQTLTEKIDDLTQSVWGVSNNELTEIVYKIDKLKQKDNYSELTIDDIRSLCTFGDVWYHDLTQSQIIWGEWLINK